MKNWFLPVVVGAVALAASGCGGGGLFGGNTANVGFVNLSVDETSVDIFVNNREAFSDVSYGSVPQPSDWRAVPQPAATFQAQTVNGSTVFHTETISNFFDQNRGYLVFFTGFDNPSGGQAPMSFFAVPGAFNKPSGNRADVRVINMVSDPTRVLDVYIQTTSSLPGSPSDNKNDLSYKQVGSYTGYDAQQYTISVTGSTGNSPVLDSQQFTFVGGEAYSIVLIDGVGGTVDIIVIREA
ncbi:MAG: DUF4397 domain-containing protein [Fimbriimonadaceae bacterium]